MIATFKPPKPRIRLRRSETAERLLDGAFDVFAEKGFDAATIDDICKRVHMTRGAFYSSFKTKEELFQSLFTLQMGRLTERLRGLWKGVEKQPSPLSAAIERYIATELHDGRWLRLLSEHRQLAARSSSDGQAMDDLSLTFSETLGLTLEQLMRSCGRKLTVPPQEVAIATFALVEAATWRGAIDALAAEAFLRTVLLRLLTACSEPLDE